MRPRLAGQRLPHAAGDTTPSGCDRGAGRNTHRCSQQVQEGSGRQHRIFACRQRCSRRNRKTAFMREVVFQLRVDHPGALIAKADSPAIHITAPSLEELHHEAREALIQHFRPAHATYRCGSGASP